MRATWKLWNQKSFDSEPFLFARMAALCPRVLLQQLLQLVQQCKRFAWA